MSPEDAALGIAGRLVAAAREAGADDAEVFLRHGPIVRLSLHDGHLRESLGQESSLVLRVWCGGRSALITANDPPGADPVALAGPVVRATREHGVPDQPRLADDPAPRRFPRADEEATPTEAKVALLTRLHAAASAGRGTDDTILSVWHADAAPTTVLVNSHGFAGAYPSRQHAVWVWLEEAGGHVAAAATSRRFADLAGEELVRSLRERSALAGESAATAPTGPAEVLLPPDVGADLARSLGHLLAADPAERGLNPLLRQLGQPIVAEAVTLIDDGVGPAGLKSRPFDDEGTPTEITHLVRRGTLEALLHTRATAAALGVPPNGKATRPRLWERPSAAPTNVYFAAGDATPEALRGRMRRGVELVGTLRPGRLHSATGNFTAVGQGWWVEGGERVRPVRGVRLSANVMELLRGVRATGTDLRFSPLADGAGSPTALIDRMEVG